VVRNLRTALAGPLEAVFESGVLRVPAGIYGWSPAVFGYDTLTSGQDERRLSRQRGAAQCPFSAGPWTRPEGRARRPLASQASTSKSALSPARLRINSSCHRGRPTPGTGNGNSTDRGGCAKFDQFGRKNAHSKAARKVRFRDNPRHIPRPWRQIGFQDACVLEPFA
jgi:hypothetical protein